MFTRFEIETIAVSAFLGAIAGLLPGGITYGISGEHGPTPEAWCDIAKRLFNCSTPRCPMSLEITEPACLNGSSCPDGRDACTKIEGVSNAENEAFLGFNHDPKAWLAILVGAFLGMLLGVYHVLHERGRNFAVRDERVSLTRAAGGAGGVAAVAIYGSAAGSAEDEMRIDVRR